MVQRKVPNKPALQSDHHVKSQSQNKGTADLKKKMKKSGSIKRPELDALRSSSLKKPPPNYMKSTTSSDARKEQSQSQVSTNTSSLRRKSSSVSKVESSSCNKSTKTSVKTTSLKMIRSLTKNPSFKPARGYVKRCPPVVLCENIDANKATCSSTLKDHKFPDYLSLNPEGTSTVKVCPYTYCSLNGHQHRAPLPPLKCFLSARRRLVKNIKLGCLSPRSVKPSSPMNEEKQDDFFVEIYCKKNEETMEEDREERAMETLSDAPISYDVVLESLDENRDVNSVDADNIYFSQEFTVDEEFSPIQEENKLGFLSESLVESMANSEASEYDYEYLPETEIEPDPDEGKDEFIINSYGKGGNYNEFVADEVSQESFDEESFDSDAFSISDNVESTGSCDYLQSLNDRETSEVPAQELEPAHEANLLKGPLDETITSSHQGQHVHTEFCDEDQTSNAENQDGSTENFVTSSLIDPANESHSKVSQKLKTTNAAEPETEDNDVSRAAAKCKKLIEQNDESGLFNPRAPNFLPVEPDPQGEKVDLRHQDLDERKNAEEWMVDYALRKVVTKLGPARKRKVALLVEAFEKVMPVTKCEIHLRHGSVFDQARTVQACS